MLRAAGKLAKRCTLRETAIGIQGITTIPQFPCEPRPPVGRYFLQGFCCIEFATNTDMSCLYSPYRAIGYVCDSNPFVINRLGEEIFITVSIGKCFQIFRMNKLVACLVSKTAPGAISGLQAIGHETFVNVDKSIVVYDRANIVRKYEVHTSPIVGSVSVGTMLLSFDQENNIKVCYFRVSTFIIVSVAYSLFLLGMTDP